MARTPETLLQQLHSRTLSREVRNRFVRVGVPAYSHLVCELSGDRAELSELQVCNGLVLIVDPWFQGDRNRALEAVIACSEDHRVCVRSKAVDALIGIVHERFFGWRASEFHLDVLRVREVVARALKIGLDRDVAEGVEVFLRTRGTIEDEE